MAKVITDLLNNPRYYGIKVFLCNGEKLLITDFIEDGDSILHLQKNDINYLVPESSILYVEAIEKIS